MEVDQIECLCSHPELLSEGSPILTISLRGQVTHTQGCGPDQLSRVCTAQVVGVRASTACSTWGTGEGQCGNLVPV